MSDMNGESGIRTHAPFRTNGFQDRLVMTASISLHVQLQRTVSRVPFDLCFISAQERIYHDSFFLSTIFLFSFQSIFLFSLTGFMPVIPASVMMVSCQSYWFLVRFRIVIIPEKLNTFCAVVALSNAPGRSGS